MELSYPANKTVVNAALRVCGFPLLPSSLRQDGGGHGARWAGLRCSGTASFPPSAAHLPPPLPAVASPLPAGCLGRPGGAHLAHQPRAGSGGSRGETGAQISGLSVLFFFKISLPGDVGFGGACSLKHYIGNLTHLKKKFFF